MQPLVSFIIPHKGRNELLRETIQSIEAQDYDNERVEVVVATQDKGLAIDGGNIKVISFDALETISKLRNEAAQRASGEYFAFLDADIKLSQNWLSEMFLTLNSHPDHALVSAGQIAGSESALEKIWVRINSRKVDHCPTSLDGRNLFLKKEIFQKTGGFPEDLATCEDIYFTFQVGKLGKIYVTPRASYVHLGEDRTYSDLFKKEVWRAGANLKSLKGRNIPLREIPSIVIPFWQTACAIVLVVSLALSKSLWVLLSLGAFLFAPLLYALRLYLFDRQGLKWYACFWFYVVYFSGRSIGTLAGLKGFFKKDDKQKI